MNDSMLYEKLESGKAFIGEDCYKKIFNQHQDIISSLNPKFKLREYQLEAIGRCIYYIEEYKNKELPYHLLFNMATGSGKTLIMAAVMLYLYKRGYRNFIFFTHLSNIIEKTKDNFLNRNSSKYLFSQDISLGGQRLSINEVDSFDAGSERDINITFTTMAGLHNKWQNPKENGLSADDLADKKIVLLGDEAHHFSAKTKKLGSSEEKENNNWEHTILAKQDDSLGDNYPGLLYTNPNDENILLEFTATLNWDDPQIEEKYRDKILYRYDLAEFRKDGYSKNIRTLQFDAPYFDRCLAAIVLSQYRLKVSQRYKLKPRQIKPVILFKSNRINEPEDKNKTQGDNPNVVVSNQFKELFHKRIAELSPGELERIKTISMRTKENKDGDKSDDVIKKAFEFFETESISMEHLAREIRGEFALEYCLSVDSKGDLEDKQLILNSLEDENNNIRAVFATEKLNEGWDVLNLFDIVRLYDSRDARDNKPGKSTIQEAQLIGRGARYCPFVLGEKDDLYKRKFDDDPDNPLVALELLHYHCTHNPKYVSELNKVLEEQGSKDKESGEYTIEPKQDIPHIAINKDKVSWKDVNVFLNERITRPQQTIDNAINDALLALLDEVASPEQDSKALNDSINEHNESKLTFRLRSMAMEEDSLGTDINKIVEGSVSDLHTRTKKIRVKASDLGENILRYAIGTYPEAHFDNLSAHISDIKSISDFIHIIMNKVEFILEGRKEDMPLNQDQKLYVAKKIVGGLLENLFKHRTDYVGSKEYKGKQLGEIFGKPKVRQFRKEKEEEYGCYKANRVSLLVNQPWFAQSIVNHATNQDVAFLHFTNQEVAFLEFVDEHYEDIKKLYNYFLIFRNDNHFNIYNTENTAKEQEGEAFSPDFLMVSRKKNSKRIITDQVFVEAKGPQFLNSDKTSFKGGHEAWKENFLLRIMNEAKINVADKDIKLMGLPFFHTRIDNKGNAKMQKLFKDNFENDFLANPADGGTSSDSAPQ